MNRKKTSLSQSFMMPASRQFAIMICITGSLHILHRTSKDIGDHTHAKLVHVRQQGVSTRLDLCPLVGVVHGDLHQKAPRSRKPRRGCTGALSQCPSSGGGRAQGVSCGSYFERSQSHPCSSWQQESGREDRVATTSAARAMTLIHQQSAASSKTLVACSSSLCVVSMSCP